MKKIMSLIIIGILVLSGFGVVATPDEEQNAKSTVYQPSLIIERVLGGMGIKIFIRSNGDAEVKNVKWSITLEGFLVFFPHGTVTGTLGNIPAGEYKFIILNVLGFAAPMMFPASLSIEVTADNAPPCGFSYPSLMILLFMVFPNRIY